MQKSEDRALGAKDYSGTHDAALRFRRPRGTVGLSAAATGRCPHGGKGNQTAVENHAHILSGLRSRVGCWVNTVAHDNL